MNAGVDATLGPLLIGTWINALLYMLEITQLVTFFNLFPKERIGIKATVLSSFAIDTFATGSICACVYKYCVTHWGDRGYASGQNFGFPIYGATTAWSACIMQLFLTWRYYVVSKNIVVAALILGLVAMQVSACMTSIAFVIKYTSLKDRWRMVSSSTIWIVSTASADVLVAIALLWELRSMKSSYARTKSIIRRLTATIISTGTVTALIATTILITYLVRQEENITVGIGFIMGRACSLTTLVNLNSRLRGRRDGESSDSPNTGQWQAEHSQSAAYDLRVMVARGESIAICQTSIVHVDDSNKLDLSRRDSDPHLTPPTAKVRDL